MKNSNHTSLRPRNMVHITWKGETEKVETNVFLHARKDQKIRRKLPAIEFNFGKRVRKQQLFWKGIQRRFNFKFWSFSITRQRSFTTLSRHDSRREARKFKSKRRGVYTNCAWHDNGLWRNNKIRLRAKFIETTKTSLVTSTANIVHISPALCSKILKQNKDRAENCKKVIGCWSENYTRH